METTEHEIRCFGNSVTEFEITELNGNKFREIETRNFGHSVY